MRNYRDLHVYQKAHSVAIRVNTLCEHIPGRKYPGLASQLRRASASVPANIVEGCSHSSRHEFARFLQLALASNGEVDYHLQFALDTKAIADDAHAGLASVNQEVRRMLAALLRRVRDELSEAAGKEQASERDTTSGSSTTD